MVTCFARRSCRDNRQLRFSPQLTSTTFNYPTAPFYFSIRWSLLIFVNQFLLKVICLTIIRSIDCNKGNVIYVFQATLGFISGMCLDKIQQPGFPVIRKKKSKSHLASVAWFVGGGDRRCRHPDPRRLRRRRSGDPQRTCSGPCLLAGPGQS